MTRYHGASSTLTLLVLLTATSFLHLSTPSPLSMNEDADNPHRDTFPGLIVSGNRERRDEERRIIPKEQAEEEEELFKDVDPKLLATILLEALNRSHVEGSREGEEHDGVKEKIKAERGEIKKEEAYREVRPMEEVDQDRGGRQDFELLMAAQGKEQERKEEDEKKKAQEEEEKMTEKVISRTTSQTVQMQMEQQPTSSDGREENDQGAAFQQGSTNPDQGSHEEEEQLSPEELKSLETMMKEFPRLNTATKREGGSEKKQRESRGYSSHNDILTNKGSDLAMSKKKLKWQEETQKALNFPTFRGGNFMDEFEGNIYGSNAAQPQPPAEQEVMKDDETEEEQDEEVLSPEEEEARAKAEQEEMRRQAAEAQRAKLEEEKLADIASDMLLHYMVKQNNGNKKYTSSLSNAAEDKRSDEEQEVTEEDDIDPQTIDKLIEISSKLHLPADDVVDIISDVEKKKKKDLPTEITSRWRRPLSPLTSPLSTALQIPTVQNNLPVSKQPPPAVNLLKTWFQDKTPKPLLANKNIWPKPQKLPSIKQELWLTPPKSVWSRYPFYSYTYPPYYQRNPYPDYYPIYFPPPPRPRPKYFIPKSAVTLSNFLGNSMDNTYTFPPKRRYRSWVQPQLRQPPPGLQQKSYYTSYPDSLYPRIFQPAPIPKARSPLQMSVIPPQQNQFFYSAPAVTRNKDYYMAEKQPKNSNHDDLEKYLQQILMRRQQMKD
ncbi:neurosecretory protein VGF [Amphiprion ocellaris]|uniref:VGF nerve growth factor inducible n=1 Tax=Amphiprion ocellaris TaxID=80972 RepID=A0A3Q1BIQ3_AMPOC|nr:neurosecretory protein VGF [Amphiprion ocellaris]